jgi:hypothetical protein
MLGGFGNDLLKKAQTPNMAICRVQRRSNKVSALDP